MPDTLTAQIEDTERQVLVHKREASLCTAMLTRKLRQQITEPSSLLLASSVGFILGELTKRQPKKPGGAANTTAAATSPLTVALNLITSARTLYTALPLAWMVKTFCQPKVPEQKLKPQFRQTEAYVATGRRRRASDYSR